VTVVNVAPTLVLAGAATVDEGAAYTLTLGAVTDPGTDTVVEWIVDWATARRTRTAPEAR